MEHMAEPLQLAFKHSIYSRNYYIEEDEGEYDSVLRRGDLMYDSFRHNVELW